MLELKLKFIQHILHPSEQWTISMFWGHSKHLESQKKHQFLAGSCKHRAKSAVFWRSTRKVGTNVGKFVLCGAFFLLCPVETKPLTVSCNLSIPPFWQLEEMQTQILNKDIRNVTQCEQKIGTHLKFAHMPYLITSNSGLCCYCTAYEISFREYICFCAPLVGDPGLTSMQHVRVWLPRMRPFYKLHL